MSGFQLRMGEMKHRNILSLKMSKVSLSTTLSNSLYVNTFREYVTDGVIYERFTIESKFGTQKESYLPFSSVRHILLRLKCFQT